MTRKALLLFIAASVIWGSSFLFIRLAVEHMPPATVVFGRTLLGAAFLVPLAVSRRAFRGVRPVIVPIIVVPFLRKVSAFVFLFVWFLEQVVAGTIDRMLTHAPGGVAWWAHVGGFVAGFALAPILRRL